MITKCKHTKMITKCKQTNNRTEKSAFESYFGPFLPNDHRQTVKYFMQTWNKTNNYLHRRLRYANNYCGH
jgi:hypothetical protein